MMANKEKLEQLCEYIKRLTTLTEEISERDIYPVSFFSQAYDLTNTIQEELRQIEIAQIDLFEKQMKEHQAQILSIIPHQGKLKNPENQGKQGKPGEQEKANMLAESDEHVLNPIPQTPPDVIFPNLIKGENLEPLPLARDISAEIPSPIYSIPPIPPPKKDPAGEIPRVDLKKIFTLNDRFLFCRELFSNNENLMNQTIADLNKTESFEASMDYIKIHFNWNIEDDHVASFIACLKKSFLTENRKLTNG